MSDSVQSEIRLVQCQIDRNIDEICNTNTPSHPHTLHPHPHPHPHPLILC